MKPRLGNAVYAALPFGGFIFLDLENDEYLGLNSEDSSKLIGLLNYSNGCVHEDCELIKNLQSVGILSKIEGSGREFTYWAQKNPSGLTVCDWRPSQSSFPKITCSSLTQILRALLSLSMIDYRLSKRGMAETFKRLPRTVAINPTIWDDKVAMEIASVKTALDIARCIYWMKTDCLVNSLALFDLSIRQGLPVQINIGVQKYPFYAHAWVVYAGRVVNDHPEVAERLAVIMSIGASSCPERSPTS